MSTLIRYFWCCIENTIKRLFFCFINKENFLGIKYQSEHFYEEIEPKITCFNVLASQSHIRALLVKKNFSSLQTLIKPVEKLSDAVGIESHEEIPTCIFSNRQFIRVIRNALNHPKDAILIAKEYKSVRRDYGDGTYDVKTSCYLFLLLPDNRYTKVFMGNEYSSLLDLD